MADLKQKLKNIKSAYKLELNREKVGVGTVVPMTQAIAGSALLIGGAPIAHKIEKFFKKRKEKKETKQKQSMTSNKAYSSKFFGHTDNKNKQEKPMARKKKTRTVSDVIEDIRELHEKEEDFLMELEDLTEESDIDEGDE